MSWTRRWEIFRSIEQKIKSKTVTVEELLDEEGIVAAVSQRVDGLSRFLGSHIREMIDIVASTETESESRKGICAKIMANMSGALRDRFICDTENFGYFIGKFYEKDADDGMLLSILTVMNRATDDADGGTLARIPDRERFFAYLVSRIDQMGYYDFTYMIMMNGTTLGNLSTVVSVDEILMDALDRFPYQALVLIITGLYNSESKFVRRMQQADRVTRVLEVGLAVDSAATADVAFRIVARLANLCTDKEGEGKDVFDGIIQAITEAGARLSDLVQKDEAFTTDKRIAVELITLLVSARHEVPEYVVSMAHTLCGLFFKQPANSFLHLWFLALVKEMSVMKDVFDVFLRESRLVSMMLDAFDGREMTHACFWGILHEMTSVIGATDFDFGDERDRWEHYIANEYTRTAQLMIAPYGGSLPEVGKGPCFGYDCKFVDSCDLLSRVYFEAESSDSDSGTSSSSSQSSDDLTSDVTDSDEFESSD